VNPGRVAVLLGAVVVESRPGAGTTFRALFPRAVASVPARERPPREATPHVGGATVAVAEDDETVRRLAVRVLERYGYRVIAGCGVELLDLLARHDGVDLLLTDVIMPDTDGKELYGRLCDENPGLRVLYMSGHPDQVPSERGILKVDFIAKPFTVDQLLGRVREVLNGDRLRLTGH